MITYFQFSYCGRTDTQLPESNPETLKSDPERDPEKMETEFIKVHTCGAVYSLSDCIYFDVLLKIGHQYYLKISVEEEEGVNTLLFRWDTIPDNIRMLYDYVDQKSFMDDKHTLYGCHIGRIDDRIYALAKFAENPIGMYVSIADKTIPRYNTKFFETAWHKLKQAKNIE